MNLAACNGDWLQGANGELLCDGVVQVVVGGGPFGLPPITYSDANALLAAMASVLATVWGLAVLKRVLFNGS